MGTAADPHVEALLAEADLVIEAHGLESDTGERLDVAGLRAAHPVPRRSLDHALRPDRAMGRSPGDRVHAPGGVGVDRHAGPDGEGAHSGRGPHERVGGGTFGAVAALPAVFRARATGQGEHIDLSMLETANFVFTNFSESMNRLMNGSPEDPEHAFLAQSVETPSIEPTADGYVGFCTNSRQQFSDFLLMIERPDLQARTSSSPSSPAA